MLWANADCDEIQGQEIALFDINADVNAGLPKDRPIRKTKQKKQREGEGVPPINIHEMTVYDI